MIQRIQTLYMVLALVVVGILVGYFPMWLVGEKPFMIADNPVYLFGLGLSLGIVLANIFNFKKRKLQVVLNRLVIFISFAVFGFMLYEYITLKSDETIYFGYSLLSPLAMVVFLSLANRGIIKDEELIRSADRIR